MCWPRQADVTNLAESKTGYMRDEDTLNVILNAIGDGYDLIIAQLQRIDTSAHASGINSELTREAYRAADEAVGQIAMVLGRDWERSLLIVISDHRAENVVRSEPVRLAAALEGIAGVIEDGSAALVRPLGVDLAPLFSRVRACSGVAAFTPIDDKHFVAWSEPGLVFGRNRPITTNASHGNCTTRPCLAVVSGANPLGLEVGACIRRTPPSLQSWAGVITRALSLESSGQGE